jgi:hypothetical protein
MKKCNESFDFLALTNTLDKCKDVDEGAEKQAKRFWLRAKLYANIYGFPNDKSRIEEAFFWIYNAPIKDWENMIEALRYSYLTEDAENKGLLQRAKELFAFLS